MNFDRSKYKIKNWKNFTLLHWIVNPGLAINELVLGQRIPKVMLIDKTSEKPLMERSYVPCPHCETLHDGRTWSPQNGTGYKNWFGLYCPQCGNIIPCLRNATAWVILVITFPIWGWFRNTLKTKWLSKQPDRFENISPESLQHVDVPWFIMGLAFAGFLFVLFFVMEWLTVASVSFERAGINLLAALIGGLIFGYVMKYWMGRKGEVEAN